MPGDGADLAGTTNYLLFQNAEAMHRTVGELLTGRMAPLTNMEHFLWARYRLATARLHQQARPLHKA